MSKAWKGSDFEREICKKLSLWWTQGDNPRDDVFWRTSQSGGRATFRRQKGKDTYGHHGDITAVDPIGAPLLKVFSMELKRGSSIGCAGDLIDSRPTDACRPFEAALLQAYEAHVSAKSLGWALICKRDHRTVMLYSSCSPIQKLNAISQSHLLSHEGITRFHLMVNKVDKKKQTLMFYAMPLELFLTHIHPLDVIQLCVSSD